MSRRLVTNREAAQVAGQLQVLAATTSPQIRHTLLEGRQYAVVPMVMITEGVHKGSNGALYYPADELAKTPAVWNHKPIVVYHPTENGSPISACEPAVIGARKVGIIMNTRWAPGKAGQPGKLTAEAWIELDRLKRVDGRVLNALREKKMVEVSTGLFTDNEATTGRWHGEDYEYIARNYRPDHLAILPDEKGACSIADGAGLLRNSAGKRISHEELRQQLQALIHKPETAKVVQGLHPAPAWVCDVYSEFCIYQAGPRYWKQAYAVDEKNNVSLVGPPVEVKRRTVYQTTDGKTLNSEGAFMTKKQLVSQLIANEDTNFTREDREWLLGLSLNKLRKMIPATARDLAINALDTIDSKSDDQSDTITGADGSVDARKIGSKSGAEAANVDGGLADEEDEEDDDEKGGKVKNRRRTRNTAEEVDEMDEAKKKETKNKACKNADKDDDEEDEDDKPTGNMSAEDYIAQAPPAIREMLSAGLMTHNQQKRGLIRRITANKLNRFSAEYLAGRTLQELQGLAALAGEDAKRPTANYAGMGDPGAVVLAANSGYEEAEPLELPTLNFEKR